MTKGLYSIKDELVGYNYPILQENDSEAERTLKLMIQDKNSMVSQSPKDYSIWKIGEMDMRTGEIKTDIEMPKLILRAESFSD